MDSDEPIVLWDPSRGSVPLAAVDAFVAAGDDVWVPQSHAELDRDDLFGFVEPLHIYRRIPDPVDGAVNWRLFPDATFLRAGALRQLGGPELGFSSVMGALREMGYRWLRRGAVMRQRIELGAQPHVSVPMADRYRMLLCHYSAKWARYACARRIARGAPLRSELAALQAALASVEGVARVASGAASRSLEQVVLAPHPRVTVVLPTFGRYRYVAEVLEDLRAQTIPVSEILVADGNTGIDRQPGAYEPFSDLPLEVLWVPEPGTCVSRNACLARASGDYIWFVDDDSRLAPDNLEQHLRVLGAYGADVSVGPAYTRERPTLHADQQEVRCTFMDCGTTLVRREMLERVGGFDMQFNDRLAGEDGELGIRFVRAGGLVVSNPFAKRFHYLAPVGGARASTNNVHRWVRWTLRPRPVQSIYYTGARHFDEASTREAVFQTWVLAGWKRADGVTATARWKMKTFAAEVAALPVSLIRLVRSVSIAREMARQGPQIPAFPATKP